MPEEWRSVPVRFFAPDRYVAEFVLYGSSSMSQDDAAALWANSIPTPPLPARTRVMSNTDNGTTTSCRFGAMKVFSPNGAYWFGVGNDANVVVYRQADNAPMFLSSGTASTDQVDWTVCSFCARALCIQGDSNFLQYDSGTVFGGNPPIRWARTTTPVMPPGRDVSLWVDDEVRGLSAWTPPPTPHPPPPNSKRLQRERHCKRYGLARRPALSGALQLF